MAAYGLPGKYSMNTESAILCGRDGTEAYCQAPEAAEIKSNYVVQWYASAAAAGLRANVWYSLVGWRGSGLVDAGYNPVPAYQAYQFAESMLREGAYRHQVAEFAGVNGFEFERAGQRLWVVWSLDTTPRTISLPAQPAALYDVYGNAESTTAEPSLAFAPTYLVWEQN